MINDISLSQSSSSITNPTHLNFSQRPPVTPQSGPILTLSADTYSSSTDVTLTLRVINEPVNTSWRYCVSQVILGPNDGSIEQTASMSPTDRSGEYKLTLELIGEGHIAFVAYPTKKSKYRVFIRREDYNRLAIVSNPVIVVSKQSDYQESQDLNSQYDNLVKSLTNSILAPTSGPAGDSSDPFKLRGMTSSNNRYLSSEHQNSRQVIQGSTEDISSRIAGVSDFIHNATSSEVPTVKAAAIDLLDVLDNYEKSLTGGMSVLTSVLESNRYNPASGNTVSQSVGNQNIISNQYRLESSTSLDLRAPVVVSSAQSIITDSRNSHSRSFINQSSSVHTWQRSEQSHTILSDLILNYTPGQRKDLSTKRTDVSGTQEIYADHLKIQVGSSPPVHIPVLDAAKETVDNTSSNSSNSLLDTLSDITLAAQDLPQLVGKVQDLFESPEDLLNVGPRNLDILVENNITTQSVIGDISISAARDIINYANSAIFMRSNLMASIDSSLVFINCRIIRPPLPPPTPTIHTPITPLDPLEKTDLPASSQPIDLGTEQRIPTPLAGPQ